jgi:hypothetical protein
VVRREYLFLLSSAGLYSVLPVAACAVCFGPWFLHQSTPDIALVHFDRNINEVLINCERQIYRSPFKVIIESIEQYPICAHPTEAFLQR